MTSRSFALVIAGVALVAAAVNAQQVTKQQVPGITNFARVETTIACGGVTKPEAMTVLESILTSCLVPGLARKDRGPVVLDADHGPILLGRDMQGLLGPGDIVEFPFSVIVQ